MVRNIGWAVLVAFLAGIFLLWPRGSREPSQEVMTAQGEGFSLKLDEKGFFYLDLQGREGTLQFPAGEAAQAMGGALRWRYRGFSQEGFELIVVVVETFGPQGVPQYRVELSYKEDSEGDYKELSGPAIYPMDYKLHNLWRVKEIRGQTVAASDFPSGSLPVIELNSNQSRILGSDGCNNLEGPIRARAGKIYLGNLASTRKACPESGLSNTLRRALGNAQYDYSFEGRDLVFSLRGEEVLRFINVD